MGLWKNFVFLLSTNPFEILGDPETNKVETSLGIEGEAGFALTDIAVLIKSAILYGGIVAALGSLIGLLFIRSNTKMIGEKKDRITRILLIVWAAGSAVTLFNILKTFFDSIFGF